MEAEPATRRLLLEWLRQPSSERGIRFAAPRNNWSYWPYARLADLARSFARGLLNAGLHEGEFVGVVLNSSPAFVGCLFGVMLAGATPVPMAPPERLRTGQDYWRRLAGILHVAKPAMVVVESDAPAALGEFLRQNPDCCTIRTVDQLLARGSTDIGRPAAELALLQFTSGSGGHCRAIRIPFAALEANLSAVHRWLAWRETDRAASWLPVYHDMGLIGCLLGAIVLQCHFWLLTPEMFVRSPLTFLRCFGEYGGRLAAMPNFALDHIVRRIRPEMLAGMDFSGWRGIIVGSEPVRGESLDRFYGLLAPFGFRRTSLLPAYGLAEATLAVTGLPLDEGWTQLEFTGGQVDPVRSIAGSESPRRDRTTLVGCGRPLAGVKVTIESESGDALADGHAGEIVVRGDSVGAGYAGSTVDAETRFRDGSLRTGDVGFRWDGQLFVLGRLGDSLKIRGRAVFAEDLEGALADLGIPSNRIAAVLGLYHAEPTALVLLEHSAKVTVSEVLALLGGRLSGARLLVREVAHGVIRRTSSGKVRRRELWRAFCDGRIPALGAQDDGRGVNDLPRDPTKQSG